MYQSSLKRFYKSANKLNTRDFGTMEIITFKTRIY